MDKKERLTVSETAERFEVTKMSVYNWIKNGLKHDTEKIIGKKPRIVIDPEDVKKFHGI